MGNMMKRFGSILLMLALCFCFAACSKTKEVPPKGSEVKQNEVVQVTNPWVTVGSMEEAAKATGFDFIVPDAIEELSPIDISVMDNQLIQVVYKSDDGAKEIVLRKALGSDDISGDYNKYETEMVECGDNISVTYKGNDSVYYVLLMQKGDCSYSITCDGLSTQELDNIAKEME